MVKGWEMGIDNVLGQKAIEWLGWDEQGTCSKNRLREGSKIAPSPSQESSLLQA